MAWRDRAPRGVGDRRALYNRCGKRAFLLPDTRRPGYSKYPVMSKGSRACRVDCEGLRAAKLRATLNTGQPNPRVRKAARKVAGRAERMLRRHCPR